MTCYKDRTWCTFYSTCKKNTICERVLLPSVEAAAIDSGLPVRTFAAPPACHTDFNKGEGYGDG